MRHGLPTVNALPCLACLHVCILSSLDAKLAAQLTLPPAKQDPVSVGVHLSRSPAQTKKVVLCDSPRTGLFLNIAQKRGGGLGEPAPFC